MQPGSIDLLKQEYNNRRKIKRQNESPEEKKAQLEKQRLQKKRSQKNESLDQREHILAKIKEYGEQQEKVEKVE